MEAILCKITDVVTRHPDYIVKTDYRHNDVFVDIGILVRCESDRWKFDRKKQYDQTSFCAPGYVSVGDSVLRFPYLPDPYIKKYHFDPKTVWDSNFTVEMKSGSEIKFIGSNVLPKYSIAIPTKLIWGESKHIKHDVSRDFVSTEQFGTDYSKVLGW